ncbi:macrophage mannose receptor 1-like isoform X1 [Acipenser oxyrinchus oxyrinchus]|uniref:Macrophage mannose receptor 1-like isoform X1 n=1 Tax=Acipenser oxyrinchus oxyrinchus TaxID=40147 RepID=A0AAD8CRH4_ACIOX|nr:macrophage mannose receptor 1-like isoform X1 [Acipenser oxyrinchus oxyrinchus]
MEKLVLLMLLLAGICAVASDHFRKYHFVKDEKSWFDAQSYCRENHTDLATIESQEETEKVFKITGGFTDAWIGLYYDKENWQWSNGDNVSYYNWTSSLNCTSVDSKGEWVDSACHDNKHFMCYNETRESYILIDQPKTWYEAQQYCRKNYTDLVSIKNNDEDKKIKEKANGNPVWIANQERGKWNDAGCHNTSPFFCYNESCTDASCTKYHFVKTDMNWSAAQTHCRDKYTDLATVHSQEEAKQLLDILNISANAWIGIYRDGNENWQWSNGDAVTYNMRRTKLFCATVNPDGDWTDSVCHDKKHFMCYDNGKKLFLVNENKTWEEAVEYCRSNHTDLVSIESEQELQRVYREANEASSSHVWLGLLQSCTFGFWYWVDGAQSCYDNWAPEPRCQSGYNQCGVMTARSDSKWTEKPCTERFNFICYNGKWTGFVF